jgi:malate synthase
MEDSYNFAKVSVNAPHLLASDDILTPDALRFLGFLCETFEDRRQALLARRQAKAQEFDAGDVPRFLNSQRNDMPKDWKCAPLPSDLKDRRVEITGPVDRKMVINGLNSGANVYMVSHSTTFKLGVYPDGFCWIDTNPLFLVRPTSRTLQAPLGPI